MVKSYEFCCMWVSVKPTLLSGRREGKYPSSCKEKTEVAESRPGLLSAGVTISGFEEEFLGLRLEHEQKPRVRSMAPNVIVA